MNKFTPGPWFFCMSDSDTCEFEVCTKGDVIAGEYGILSESNARLIAAAPDLLEALIHLRYNAYRSGAEMGIAIDVADEAIAKARGES